MEKWFLEAIFCVCLHLSYSFDALRKDWQKMKMRNSHLKAYEGMKTEEEWVKKIKIVCFASSCNYDGLHWHGCLMQWFGIIWLGSMASLDAFEWEIHALHFVHSTWLGGRKSLTEIKGVLPYTQPTMWTPFSNLLGYSWSHLEFSSFVNWQHAQF